MKEDLQNRTKQFAINVFFFCNELSNKTNLKPFVNQLIRSSSSVGANYRAACRAKSAKDFINKLKIVEEEADESIYFLELLREVTNENESKIKTLTNEGNEILAIIVASIKTARARLNKNNSSFQNRQS